MLVKQSCSWIRTIKVHLFAVGLFALTLSGFLTAEEICKIPAIYNFGDSNSDTGSESATFGRVPFPYGITFPGKPSGRFSDGRLIIDFFGEPSLTSPAIISFYLRSWDLSAYLDAIEADFHHGANFAVAANSIEPTNGTLFGIGLNPLALNLQLLQFQQLKLRSTELQDQAKSLITRSRLPRLEDFSKALYTFDIGQNDIAVGLLILTEHQLHELVHELVNYLSLAIQNVYQLGGRRFWIHNTGPIGCFPLALKQGTGKSVDDIGCIKPYNEVAQKFNRLLKQKVIKLQAELHDSVLIYVDIYSAKYSFFRKAKKEGFVSPFGYCCEDCSLVTAVPYWKRQTMLQTNVRGTPCDHPSHYISWDGLHYTEAANRRIVNQIFEGSFTDPSTPFAKFCM